MKKVLLFVVVGLIALMGAGCGTTAQQTPTSTDVEESPVATATEALPEATKDLGYQNATFEVEGTSVALVNGVSEVEAAPGSATKIITRYFGNEAFGDLNGDGKEDVAFLITQDRGGSGMFYYVVAALQTETGYQGTNAVLLGDRIAPQTSMIADGLVTVNYADRKPDEPFTAEPSVGISKYLKISDGKLVETYVPAQITRREWKWVQTQMNDGTVTSPKKADAFTITFKEDGSLIGTTDCNDFSGGYKMDDNKLSFGPFLSTRMACEGSQEGEFVKSLGEVNRFLIDQKENTLVLLFKVDSGSMTFK